MEVVTDGLLVTNGNSTNGCVVGTPPTSTTIIAEEEDADEAFDAIMEENGDAQNNLQEYEKYLPVIEFGQSVAALSNQMGSAPKKLLNRMNDAFCLICHSNLLESNKAYLLDQSQRTIAAKALNSAILQNIAREASPMSDELKSSPLDDLFRRAHFSRERAMNVSAAGAAFVTADRICFDSSPDISQGAAQPAALSC
ncbi:hypothetical protein AAVH_05585 [Aphelenchoides avenae]|nr:hypothetical protein AAVH_05585 [Aphelenchus avenae]